MAKCLRKWRRGWLHVPSNKTKRKKQNKTNKQTKTTKNKKQNKKQTNKQTNKTKQNAKSLVFTWLCYLYYSHCKSISITKSTTCEAAVGWGWTLIYYFVIFSINFNEHYLILKLKELKGTSKGFLLVRKTLQSFSTSMQDTYESIMKKNRDFDKFHSPALDMCFSYLIFVCVFKTAL